jgi:hypothetical protein
MSLGHLLISHTQSRNLGPPPNQCAAEISVLLYYSPATTLYRMIRSRLDLINREKQRLIAISHLIGAQTTRVD